MILGSWTVPRKFLESKEWAEIKMLVLDEADEMLNRGFKEQASGWKSIQQLQKLDEHRWKSMKIDENRWTSCVFHHLLEVYDIYRYLPPSTQATCWSRGAFHHEVVLVSATMPHEVLEMTHKPDTKVLPWKHVKTCENDPFSTFFSSLFTSFRPCRGLWTTPSEPGALSTLCPAVPWGAGEARWADTGRNQAAGSLKKL